MDRLEIRALMAPWYSGVQVLIKQGNATAEPLVMVERQEGREVEPTLHISKETAQTLMDDLWFCGLRPSEGTGSAGSLKATERHLEDMRKLVFEGK